MDLKEIQSKDVQAIISVLKDAGIEDYEPRVVNQLLEFSYRYVTTVIEDARSFSSHAGKRTIDADDIKAAIKSKVDYSFTTTPPRELLVDISKTKNKNPLPPVKFHAGIRLPPDRFCLHSANYALKEQEPAEIIQPKAPMSAVFSAAATSTGPVGSPSLTKQQSETIAQPFPITSIKRRRDEDEDYDV